MTGVYRYVPLSKWLLWLAAGWKFAADLGPTHGEWSVLMWWCNGSCGDGEAP